MREQVRELADNESTSGNVDETELKRRLNGSIRRWHGKIVRAVPERFETIQTITANGSESYAVNADHLATLGVELVEGDERYPLMRATHHSRNNWGHAKRSPAMAYRFASGAVYLFPRATEGSYRHIYAKVLPALVADGDTIDAVNGWEQWPILDSAIQLLMKEESHPAVQSLMAERAAIEDEITMMARARELANPGRVADVNPAHLRLGMRDPDFWSYRA